MAKTWIEKFDTCKPHYVKQLDKNFAGMKASQMMLIPSTQIVDQAIRVIPHGQSLDVVELRQRLADQYQAEITCPIATGFVMRTVAEAMFERYNQGEAIDHLTPIWRVLDKNSKTLVKLSFDQNFILDLRQQEGLD